MTSGGAVKIFSSHRWAYNNHRQGLHNLLSPWAKGVDFVDYSIPKAHPVRVEDDLQLAREIQDRIRSSDVLLVFAGMYVNFSEWVKLETLCAFFDHCPIIAVVPNGQERIATTATKFADKTVRWRGDSIRGAIWDLLPESRRIEIAQARVERARAAQLAAAGLVPPRQLPMRNALGPPPSSPTTGQNAFAGLLPPKTFPQSLLDRYRKK